MLFACDVPHTQTFAFDDDPRIDCLVGFVLAHVVPDMCPVGFDHVFGIVCECLRVHVRCSIIVREGAARIPIHACLLLPQFAF